LRPVRSRRDDSGQPRPVGCSLVACPGVITVLAKRITVIAGRAVIRARIVLLAAGSILIPGRRDMAVRLVID